MTKTHQPLFSDAYLRAAFVEEYAQFQNSEAERTLIKRLENWQVGALYRLNHAIKLSVCG